MPIVVPVDMITTTTITSFEIDSIEVTLFLSANIRVNVFSGSYRTDVRNILIVGDDYVNWGNDDQYINNYVATVLGFTIAEPVIVEPSEPVIVEPTEPVIVEPPENVIVEPPETVIVEPPETVIVEPPENVL